MLAHRAQLNFQTANIKKAALNLEASVTNAATYYFLLILPAAKSTSYRINSVLFRACLLWNSLPQSIKYSESIVVLKTKMKDLGNIDCSCILCRWIVQKIKALFTLWMQGPVLRSMWHAHGCVWLPHWYYFSVCFHMINFYHIYCDEWLAFISFSYCSASAIKLFNSIQFNQLKTMRRYC